MSWDLALRADGCAHNTLVAYRTAVRNLSDWLADHHPQIGPLELEREHVRGWLVHVRETWSSATARGWFAGVRHFCRWVQAEGETNRDAAAEIKTPAPGDPETPVLDLDDFRALLATCTGNGFIGRRDTAILMVLLDGGLRLSELAGLKVTDVELRDRMVFVEGKASRRSGPRHRAVPLGVKAARALDGTCVSGGVTRSPTSPLFGSVAETSRGSQRMASTPCSSAVPLRPGLKVCIRTCSGTRGRTPSGQPEAARAT
jgi:site-specific recombinase XerD